MARADLFHSIKIDIPFSLSPIRDSWSAAVRKSVAPLKKWRMCRSNKMTKGVRPPYIGATPAISDSQRLGNARCNPKESDVKACATTREYRYTVLGGLLCRLLLSCQPFYLYGHDSLGKCSLSQAIIVERSSPTTERTDVRGCGGYDGHVNKGARESPSGDFYLPMSRRRVQKVRTLPLPPPKPEIEYTASCRRYKYVGKVLKFSIASLPCCRSPKTEVPPPRLMMVLVYLVLA